MAKILIVDDDPGVVSAVTTILESQDHVVISSDDFLEEPVTLDGLGTGDARIIGTELAWEIVKAFVGAEFTGEERHVRRVGKIDQLDRLRS